MSYRRLRLIADPDTRVATVLLNRPTARNALDDVLRKELAAVFSALTSADDTGAAVLIGEGEAFCAGADLPHGSRMYRERDFDRYDRRYSDLNAWYSVLTNFPKGLVVGLNGHALGSGLQLALTGDVLLSVPDAELGLPQVTLGLSPHLPTLAKLSQTIGYHRTLRHALTGSRISAQDAHDWGLVAEVVESTAIRNRAESIAERLAAQPPTAMKSIKQGLRAAITMTNDQAMFVDEFKSFALASTSTWRANRGKWSRRIKGQ